jgi:hypothetical protein
MRRVDITDFSHKASFRESAINDLNQEKGQTQSYIDGIKNRISNIDLERGDFHPGKGKYRNEERRRSGDSFDLFRMIKQGFMNIIKGLHNSGDINKEEYKELKSEAKDFFKDNGKDLKKMFLNISQRDLESQLAYIDSKILGQERSSTNINYEQEEIQDDNSLKDPQSSQSAKTNNDGKSLELTLTSTLKFNNIGNSLLNLLNKVDPFNSPDEVDPAKKEILNGGIINIQEKTRELILSLDPSLKEDLDAIAAKTKANPDSKEAYLDYSVAMVPIDIASKAIDVVNNEREGFQQLADIDRKTLSADMLDFFEYITNLKNNLA